MLVGLFVAGFLLAHAAIHVAFIAPPPAATAGGPAWPFAIDRAWPVSRLGIDPIIVRSVAVALIAATIAGYAVAAVTALGFLPMAIWPAGIAIGSIASLGLLAICFHPWLILGVAIDLALLWSCVVVGWHPGGDGWSA